MGFIWNEYDQRNKQNKCPTSMHIHTYVRTHTNEYESVNGNGNENLNETIE